MPQSLEKYDAIIVGAGAAGLMCAIEAGKAGLKVLILDRAKNVGKKILVSGGGKCNFTNLNISPENYISQNPDFCRHALEAFTPKDFLRLTAKHGIEYFEKKSGQFFCAGGSEEILSLLAKERKKAGVKIILDCEIAGISRGDDFLIGSSVGKFRSSALVIATGGKSYPQLGASGYAYIVAEQFGIDVTEIRPALVPLVFDAPEKRLFRDLRGLAIDAEVECGTVSFRDNILFTHKGLSGPA
ncbi:MAG: aminoacetone oxidase family FAD-binding enzyme, partial [bacterium]